jgi:hypothetical protein
MLTRVLTASAIAGTVFVGASQTPGRGVSLVRLPAAGIQPQASVDAGGVVHVVYFSGEPGNGDLFYATVTDAGAFSTPIRVNSEPGSAIATGTVRGARLAIGRNGRVHVTWNGSGRATPKATGGATPMLYARFDPQRRAFEPQRNLLQFAVGLDGGGAIAADEKGRVFVAWHAGGPDSKGEGDRRAWVTRSTDDGATFSREQAASDISTGACGCCGMDGLIDHQGSLYLLYRSAREVMNRDTYLLRSADSGRTFTSTKLQEWHIGACPMSTFALTENSDGVFAAWETAGQVQFARVSGGTADVGGNRVEMPGPSRNRRHPALATNARGEILVAWSEGTAWQRGGAVVWQVFDKNGRPMAETGRAPGVPVWGLVAAHARRDGGFAVIY